MKLFCDIGLGSIYSIKQSILTDRGETVQIFKNKWFSKFAREEGILDKELCEAVRDANRGLIDVDYGGGVIKQRIARPHEGKSGGFRSIILYRQDEKAVFVFGFPKKDKDNIKIDEVRWFKKMAKSTFALSEDQLAKLIKAGDFRPVKYHEQD